MPRQRAGMVFSDTYTHPTVQQGALQESQSLQAHLCRLIFIRVPSCWGIFWEQLGCEVFPYQRHRRSASVQLGKESAIEIERWQAR